jgi:hypothetical protein
MANVLPSVVNIPLILRFEKIETLGIRTPLDAVHLQRGHFDHVRRTNGLEVAGKAVQREQVEVVLGLCDALDASLAHAIRALGVLGWAHDNPVNINMGVTTVVNNSRKEVSDASQLRTVHVEVLAVRILHHSALHIGETLMAAL